MATLGFTFCTFSTVLCVCMYVCVLDCGFVDHGCRHGAVAWRLGSGRSHVAFANQCVVGCVCTVCAVCVIQMYERVPELVKQAATCHVLAVPRVR